jgi:phenylpyruvate tautomerase PptA (4-oxalocrotonate tautomerase family)
MPIYQCSAQRGLLTDAMKAQVATAITDAHVEATGEPRVFVHVFFNELPPGIAYSAGELDTRISGITGAMGEGRILEIKQELITRITAAWSEITGQPAKQVVAGLTRDRLRHHHGIQPHPPAPRRRNRMVRHETPTPWTESKAQASRLLRGDDEAAPTRLLCLPEKYLCVGVQAPALRANAGTCSPLDSPFRCWR